MIFFIVKPRQGLDVVLLKVPMPRVIYELYILPIIDDDYGCIVCYYYSIFFYLLCPVNSSIFQIYRLVFNILNIELEIAVILERQFYSCHYSFERLNIIIGRLNIIINRLKIIIYTDAELRGINLSFHSKTYNE